MTLSDYLYYFKVPLARSDLSEKRVLPTGWIQTKMATKRFVFQGCSERFGHNDAKVEEVLGSEIWSTFRWLSGTKTEKLGIVQRT